MFRMVLDASQKAHMTNTELYGSLHVATQDNYKSNHGGITFTAWHRTQAWVNEVCYLIRDLQ